MKLSRGFAHMLRAAVLVATIASATQTLPAQAASTADPSASGKVAYVFRRDTPETLGYANFLTAKGYSVTLVPLGVVLATNFADFDLTVIADDTGNLDAWGIPPSTAAQVSQITSARKPILGIGEGGYAFFGHVPDFIGWPQGWHGPQALLNRAAGAPVSIFSAPNAIPAGTIKVYTNPSNEVGIFLGGVPADVIPVGLEPPTPDHSSVIFQGCHFLWGFSDNPDKMTGDGQNLFENYVQYARFFQCAQNPTPPPDNCYRLSKSAVPANGATVTPGSVIEYIITYAINPTGGQDCPKEGRIVDVIPDHTLYAPGSASDGIVPAPDGSLTWVVTGSGTKHFKVIVLDTVCGPTRAGTAGGIIKNTATLYLPGYLPVNSNTVTHNVQCHPIGFPNDKPPYAEDEVQVYPYPIIAGKPTEISVKLTNNTSVSTTVVVHFQASPDKFGIGILFSDFATKTVTIPPNSNVIVKTTTSFAATGHFCIQIRVDVPGYEPLLTQRNLDVTEDLKPGVADTLTFAVANPLSVVRDIQLVVDNTCPGFTAVVSPSLLTNVGPNNSDIRSAQLIVTPPNPVLLGSGCHIDVQGWLTDPATGQPKLIGGIRKLDVPPIHLPHPDIPWEEKEITVNPDPPVIGQPTQLCAAVQNPLPVARQVTLEFAVADFGAGIPFTPVATTTVILPPNSFNNYCVTWTPATGGTTHRCVLVTLKQPNYIDDRSQRNITVVRPHRGTVNVLKVPLKIMNPDGISHTLQINTNLIGVDPSWKLDIKTDTGELLPANLGPGQTLGILIGLIPVPASELSAQGGTSINAVAADDPRIGDGTSAQLTVLLDGGVIGGATIEFGLPLQVSVPIITRDAKPE